MDEDAFDESWVTVTPEIPGARVIAQGALVEVLGPTKPRTTYKVTIGKALKDEFGQLLGREESHAFKIGDAYPTFYGPSGLVDRTGGYGLRTTRGQSDKEDGAVQR